MESSSNLFFKILSLVTHRQMIRSIVCAWILFAKEIHHHFSLDVGTNLGTSLILLQVLKVFLVQFPNPFKPGMTIPLDYTTSSHVGPQTHSDTLRYIYFTVCYKVLTHCQITKHHYINSSALFVI